ncbi:MAG: thiamine phosphate synthase [Thermodesulfovibrionales bacterium]|nr:thiamine phosphate synthase [Thermodesulfovibrionales bacterium]
MIYLITDRKIFNREEDFYMAIRESLRAGIKMIQLREKDLSDRDLLKMAFKMREITAEFGARLFINNRLDIALCVKADGIHLGHMSMPIKAIKSIVEDRLQIGMSTHSIKEAIESEFDGADFLTFGPVFATPSKMKYGEPLGIQLLTEAVKKIKIPLFAIGGIKLDNLKDVKTTGAKNIALISGILASKDIYDTTKKYISLLGETT